MQQEQDDTLRSALIDDRDQFQRYAGLHSYCDYPLDSLLFFGRDAESEALEARIRAERCLLMFGRSGLGKSSLLKAAVFPALRKRHFFPFIIRLDAEIKDPKLAVLAALKDACDHSTEVELVAGDSSSGLWLYFRSTDVWHGDGVMTPVLVFDQFEEVFTHHDRDFRATLARELRELIDPTPRRVIHRLRKAGKAGYFEADAGLDLRIVFSLREEYLADLEELGIWLPSLLDQRFRILPMGRANAEQAIIQPAGMDPKRAQKRLGQLSGSTADVSAAAKLPSLFNGTVRFRFTDGSNGSDNALSVLLGVLVDRRNEIDLSMLQTICRAIEDRVLQRAEPDLEFVVDSKFLGSKEELLEVWHRYYHNTLDVVLDCRQWRAEDPAVSTHGTHIEPRRGIWAASKRIIRRFIPINQRNAARKLCEFGLLSGDGNRVSLVESAAANDYGVLPGTLSLLQRNRLVRKDSRPGLEGFYYELSHDRLADVVFDERRRSLQRQWGVQLGLGVGATTALLVALFFWMEYEESNNATKQVQRVNQMDAANLTALLSTDRGATRDAFRLLAEMSAPGDGKPGEAATASTATPPPNQKPGLRDQFQDGSGRKGPPMAPVPRGEFQMGSASETRTNEQPQHPVSINYDFHMSAHELTKGEFEEYVESEAGRTGLRKGCAILSNDDGVWGSNPKASWSDPGFQQNQNHPAVCLSWQDAQGYAKWLSQQTGHCYRLPSEAEWEYAGRATSKTQFWWGDQILPNVANCITCGGQWAGYGTAPVGSFPGNLFQLYDTAGNVFEWVADCYRPDYEGAPADGSAWEPAPGHCDERVIRGGAWLMGSDTIRSAYRQPFQPSERSALVGARVVRTEGPCSHPIGGQSLQGPKPGSR